MLVSVFVFDLRVQVAMERGSRDNITVIVVDITHNAEHSPTQDASELPVPSSTQVEEGSSSRGDGEASGAGVLSGSGGGIAVGAVVQLKGRSERWAHSQAHLSMLDAYVM